MGYVTIEDVNGAYEHTTFQVTDSSKPNRDNVEQYVESISRRLDGYIRPVYFVPITHPDALQIVKTWCLDIVCAWLYPKAIPGDSENPFADDAKTAWKQASDVQAHKFYLMDEVKGGISTAKTPQNFLGTPLGQNDKVGAIL